MNGKNGKSGGGGVGSEANEERGMRVGRGGMGRYAGWGSRECAAGRRVCWAANRTNLCRKRMARQCFGGVNLTGICQWLR